MSETDKAVRAGSNYECVLCQSKSNRSRSSHF